MMVMACPLSVFGGQWLVGYLALARELISSEIECEYGDQINSFHPKTLKYQLDKRILTLQLKGDEFFDRHKRIREMIIDLGDFQASRNEVKACLKSIFSVKT